MSENMSESSGTGDSSSSALEMPHGRRSKVWEHFEQELVILDGIPKAVCKYCKLKLTSTKKSGTSSLLNHISESCPKIEAVDRDRFLATLKKKRSDVGFVFDPQRSRRLMTKFCISAEVPFQKFEDTYFDEWMESMQPTFKVVGRQTIRNDCLLTYEEMKGHLCTEFQGLNSRICLTSDMWTSVQKLGYLCITAHYIDADFVLRKKVISLKAVKYPHTNVAIEETLSRCLTEWGTKRKLLTLTLDNAENNTKAVKVFLENKDHDLLFDGADFHVRCCAHILNLLVQDGIKHIKKSIEKIRELVRHIDSSPSRIQAFNEIATSKELPEKPGLFLDIPSRWNSTYEMLQQAIKYKAVLNSYASDNGELAPDVDEWTDAEVICKFLKAFEEATKVVSADRTPTAHLFLKMILCIRNALRDPQWRVNATMEVLAGSMWNKFDKYWKESKLNVILVIATVLDPTNKLDYLDFFYEKYCEHMDDIQTCVDESIKSMRLYFEKYREHFKRSDSQPMPHRAVFNVGSPVLGKRKLEEEFAQYKSRRRAYTQPRAELDAYLEEEYFANPNENFDLLLWWKANAEKYPVLSAMARDFLAVPLSTVSSESVFSSGGRALGDTRTSLTPQMLEALVCAKDWLIKVPNNEGPSSAV